MGRAITAPSSAASCSTHSQAPAQLVPPPPPAAGLIMLLPSMSTSSMGEQIKTSSVSNYVAVGEAIPSSRQRKEPSEGRQQHGQRAGQGAHPHGGCTVEGPPSASTHIQLPEERLQLVSVLELWAVFLVQVRIDFLQELLGVLCVFLKLQKGRISHEGDPCSRDSPRQVPWARHIEEDEELLFAREQGRGKPAGGERRRQLIACFSPAGWFNPRFPALPTFNWGFTWAASRHELLPAAANEEEEVQLGLSPRKPPHGAVIWAGITEALRGWAPCFPLGRSLITSSTRPGCGRGIRPDLLPAQPPRLPDAIYQADICLQRSAGLCSSVQLHAGSMQPAQHCRCGFSHSQLCCFGGKLPLRDVRLPQGLLWGMRW